MAVGGFRPLPLDLFGVKGTFYKMPKLKSYFLVNLYFFYSDSKRKRFGNAAFFKLDMFNCKVLFFDTI